MPESSPKPVIAVHRAVRIAAVTFFGSVILCNALCYLIEMSIARSDHFYERYETGVNAPLIAGIANLLDR